jgi:FixJ family two-component response regulator
VLLTSGFSASEVSARFQGRGLAGFLQKPYTAAKLAEEVQSALSRTGKAQAT